MITSAAEEGDPGHYSWSHGSVSRLLPRQAGEWWSGGFAGWLLRVLKRTHHAEQSSTRAEMAYRHHDLHAHCNKHEPQQGCQIYRTIAAAAKPHLARGWLMLMSLGKKQSLKAIAHFAVSASLISTVELVQLMEDIQREPDLRRRCNRKPQKLSGNDRHRSDGSGANDFNQHTLSYLGKNGGSIKARRLGRSWGRARRATRVRLLLQEIKAHRENQPKNSAKKCDRIPGLKEFRVGSGARTEIELWKRRATAQELERFDRRFIAIARRMENGPTALEAIFREIEPWHLLDLN